MTLLERLRQAGQALDSELAEHLGLHIRTIEKVRDRKTWSHV